MSTILENTFASNLIQHFLIQREVDDQTANFQINNMRVPARHMGITRKEMPQIAGKDLNEFERFLSSHGVFLRKRIAPTASLSLCQSEFNKLKVIKLMRKIGTVDKLDPILVSKDGYVLDGSHRFLAVHNMRQDADIKILRASVDIRRLLDIANQFPKVTHRNYSDNKMV